jgi:large subunit ribosomal protein L32
MVVHMRHTRAHTANRRSHHALKQLNLVKCSKCDAYKRPHTVCASCGEYKGKIVVDKQKAADKKVTKAQKASK